MYSRATCGLGRRFSEPIGMAASFLKPTAARWPFGRLAAGRGRSAYFDGLPGGFHLIERRVMYRSTVLLEPRLERVEPGRELVVCLAKHVLRLEPHLSRELGQREQEIAEFLGCTPS